jgi:transcriptional regulator with XRE-family HTH domain
MVVAAAEDPSRRLARRLRALRTGGLAGERITQHDLAEALGVKPPSISSWENHRNPVVPPADRLEAYARFFATEKTVAKRPFRLVGIQALTDEERDRHDELFGELTSLRVGAQGEEEQQQPLPAEDDPFAGSPWRFPLGQDITIVSSGLPQEYLATMPYTDPTAPDYVDLYRYADLDALLELYGHIRAVNPLNHVNVRTPDEVLPDDYTSNLVLLGGVDWNSITAELLHRLDLPVRQLARESEEEPGGFEVEEGKETRMFSPVVRTIGGKETLLEDVAHFYRAPSPLNDKRTVTICNGNYQRGTLGAVRALTDARFRDRNAKYLRDRYAPDTPHSILSRVKVLLGVVVTPDWTSPDDLLHEWPVHAS